MVISDRVIPQHNTLTPDLLLDGLCQLLGQFDQITHQLGLHLVLDVQQPAVGAADDDATDHAADQIRAQAGL